MKKFSLFLLLILLTPSLFAQNVKKKKLPPVKKPVPAVKKKAPVPVVERNYIYIPYKNFAQITENQPQGVFLPLGFFQELMASFYQTPQVIPQGSPISHALLQAKYKAKVEDKMMVVHMDLTLETFGKKWKKIPMNLSGCALTQFELKTPHYLIGNSKGYSLLIKGAGRFQARATFFVKIQKENNLRKVAFQGPKATRGLFQITIPGKSLSFHSPQTIFSKPLTKDNHTQISLFLPPQANFSLSWKEKKKVIKPTQGQVEAMSIVQSTYSLEGEKHKVTLNFEIFGGIARTFAIQFPSSFEYSFLKGKYLSMIPDPQKKGKKNRLVIHLNRPVQKNYTFQFQLEKRYLQLPTKVSPPLIEVEKARQMRGYFSLYSSGEAEATPLDYKGFTRTSFQPIQKWVSPSSPYVFFYSRLATQKKHPQLFYKLLRKQPEISPTLGILTSLEENRIHLQANILLKIRKAKLLSFRICLPRGYANPYISSGNASIEKLGTNGKTGGTNFEIVLNKSALSRVSVALDSHRSLPEPCAKGKKLAKENFAAHLAHCPACTEWTKYKTTGALDLPWVLVLDGVQPRGFLSLSARSKYNLEVTDIRSLLRDSPSRQEQRWIPTTTARMQVYSTYRILKFPYAISCKLIPKKPKVFVAIQSMVTLKERLFQVKTTLNYQVSDAGITGVSFQLPPYYKAKDIRVEGPFIRSSTPPKKGQKNWKVVFQKEILGSYQLKIFYDKEIKSLPLSKPQGLPDFWIRTGRGKQRSSFVAVAKEGNITFYFTEKSLKEVDVSALPMALKKEKPFKGYELLDKNFSLKVQAMKLEYAPVLNTVVEHFHLDSVLGRDGRVQNQFFLTLRNNGRQYLPLRLPKGYKSLVLEVEGRQVLRPPRGKDDREVLVNILSSSGQKIAHKQIRLRGRYTLEGKKMGLKGDLSLSPPSFGPVPITLYTYHLYLPRGYVYRNFCKDYVHKYRPRSLFGYVGALVSGEGPIYNYNRQVDNLKGKFPLGASSFQNIILDGNKYEFYLPGPKASSDKGLPLLTMSYLGRKTVYFLYFLSLAFTIFLTLLFVRFLPFRKTAILTAEGIFILFISLFLSGGTQSFLYCSFLAILGCGAFWTLSFLTLTAREQMEKTSGKTSAKEEKWEKLEIVDDTPKKPADDPEKEKKSKEKETQKETTDDQPDKPENQEDKKDSKE